MCIRDRVWTGKMPKGDSDSSYYIARSDDFDSLALHCQWQWNYQPRKEMYSLNGTAISGQGYPYIQWISASLYKSPQCYPEYL